uniref:KIAA1549 like n=1 Tax=Anas platyrhynchos platyrhynchos TaxID=8840 RepID=A0A493T3A8_ANAPP
MSGQSGSNLPFSGAKMSSGSEFDRDVFALQPSSVQYSPLATTLPLPTTLQKKHGNIAENIINLFTTGDSTTHAQDEALLQSHMPYVNDTGVVPSSLESQTTSAGKITVLTKTLSTTPVLAFHLIDNSTLLASYEIGAAYGVLPSKAALPVTKPFSSALLQSFVTEEDVSSGSLPEFLDNQLESSGYLVVAGNIPATFSVEEWDTNAPRHSLVPFSISNKATEGMPLQPPTISPLQSVIITSVHPSPTQLTSAFLSTTNFTHSVITVLSGVSSGALPTVGTSEAKPLTRKSSPASPVPASSFFSLGTANTPLPSVMALNTPVLTLTKNNTATKLTSVLSSVGIHADLPFATGNTAASPVDMTAMFITPKSSTAMASTLAPTAHIPRQIKTTATDSQKFLSSEITKTSTPYPLTITAALTSITASAKTTRLPPTRTENTSAPPETTAAVAFANMTAAPPLDCRLSWNLMVKTVLFLNTRRMMISRSFKESVTKGLNQALRQAFNQNVSAQVEILEQSTNVTVGYYVTRGRVVFIPAAVIERLIAYGISNATADVKQHVLHLQSIATLAAPWKPLPAYHFQLKTELQFVGQTDNIQSCKFVQTMEQRLQRAFQDAERKVWNTSNNLTVQILNTSNVSQAVTLFYVVRNQSTTLNGTTSSNLLNQLSAELVGFYLTYPPLTIAESLEYPNLDVSESTRDYWVITVIQGVDIALLGLNNQSFARLMEQRLAPLFMMSHQQGRRFKRATTVGSYTVQMVKIQRIPGPKEPAELTYYTLYNGKPLLGTAAAKILSTVDSQRMALTLGYVIQVQADPVVKNPPNNLWIIAAVLAPIAVVTVIIIIITAVLCRKNKNDFKPDTMMNLPQRAKPVQGFDYAKQHLGQQGAEDEVLPVTQETVVLPLAVRDAPASQEREITQDGSTIKTAQSNETRKSQSPSQNGSIISNESGKPSSSRSSPQKVMAPQKVTKDEGRKRNGFKSSKKIVPISDEEEGGILFDNIAKSAIDPFDTSSGSVQLIAIKPVALPPVHAASDRSQESAIINGEVNKALKQKSDIEHYRNKLRLKAKRKGYYDFPQVDHNKGLTDRKRMYEKKQKEIDHILDPDPDVSSPFAEPKNRQPMKNSVYRSRQSLNSPSPGETEMDLLVTRERPRRGIRNSGYDTEPEIIEETNVDRVNEPRSYTRSRQAKGHSETSTLSSQPSIDEVRQQMHMLLEEAFSLASAGHGGQSRQEAYSSAPHLPYSEVVTSAPGTMTRPRGGVQWVPTYRPEMYQYSLPRPAYRFSQLPEMVMGSPPPPVPPRTGPVAVASLRRSTSDIGSKVRIPESSGVDPAQHHDQASFAPGSRAPMSVGPLDQSAFHSGNTVPAVFAIPAANRPGFTGYFIPTPPTAYRNQAWLPYAGENELPGQWADSVPLPGYIEAYPRPRYQHNSPSRLPRQYSQQASMHPSLEQAPLPSATASQQSLTENDLSDAPLTNISTAALVKAIREEVAKLAKKQTDMFEFQV